MNDDRVTKIETILNESFSPTHLLVKDQSHLHAGHAGARDGRGHYEVQIVSEAFAGLRPLARHRLVYDALGTLMATDIHAVQIHAKTLDEA
jgi:BolA protein